MTGRERKVIRPGYEKLNGRIYIAGPDAGNQRLEHQVTADNLQYKPGQECGPNLSVF